MIQLQLFPPPALPGAPLPSKVRGEAKKPFGEPSDCGDRDEEAAAAGEERP